jgi:Outer membrane protein beta-barrel domain
MDKDLHKNIGEQFSEEINSLSQLPREHVWENIDKALDKTDVKSYKEKFTRLKKRSLLLLLLLIGISTFSIVYFSFSKNSIYHNQTAGKETKTPSAKNEINNDGISKKLTLSTHTPIQKPESNNNISKQMLIAESEPSFLFPRKSSASKKAELNIETTTPVTEVDANNKIKLNNTVFNKLTGDIIIPSLPEKPIFIENPISSIIKAPIKDLAANTTTVKASKSNIIKFRKNYPRFSLTAFYAPDYSAYNLTNDKHNNYDNGSGIAKRERSDLSSSFGILLGYERNNKIIIQSGLIYSSSNISIDPTKIYAEKNNAGDIKFRYNASSGYGYLLPSFRVSPAVGDSLFASGANHTLHYISVPLIVKYKIGNQRLRFHPGAGVTVNFLTKATLTTDVEDQLHRETEYITRLEGIKKISYSLLLTPEVQYQLSKKISLSAAPYFKYALGAINKGNVVKSYPYTFGVGVGVVYKF